MLAMEMGGNDRINEAFEARLSPKRAAALKPNATSDLEVRDKFIQAKYKDQAFFDATKYRIGDSDAESEKGRTSLLEEDDFPPTMGSDIFEGMSSEDLFPPSTTQISAPKGRPSRNSSSPQKPKSMPAIAHMEVSGSNKGRILSKGDEEFLVKASQQGIEKLFRAISSNKNGKREELGRESETDRAVRKSSTTGRSSKTDETPATPSKRDWRRSSSSSRSPSRRRRSSSRTRSRSSKSSRDIFDAHLGSAADRISQRRLREISKSPAPNSRRISSSQLQRPHERDSSSATKSSSILRRSSSGLSMENATSSFRATSMRRIASGPSLDTKRPSVQPSGPKSTRRLNRDHSKEKHSSVNPSSSSSKMRPTISEHALDRQRRSSGATSGMRRSSSGEGLDGGISSRAGRRGGSGGAMPRSISEDVLKPQSFHVTKNRRSAEMGGQMRNETFDVPSGHEFSEVAATCRMGRRGGSGRAMPRSISEDILKPQSFHVTKNRRSRDVLSSSSHHKGRRSIETGSQMRNETLGHLSGFGNRRNTDALSGSFHQRGRRSTEMGGKMRNEAFEVTKPRSSAVLFASGAHRKSSEGVFVASERRKMIVPSKYAVEEHEAANTIKSSSDFRSALDSDFALRSQNQSTSRAQSGDISSRVVTSQRTEADDLDRGRRPLSRQNSFETGARQPPARQNSMERGNDQRKGAETRSNAFALVDSGKMSGGGFVVSATRKMIVPSKYSLEEHEASMAKFAHKSPTETALASGSSFGFRPPNENVSQRQPPSRQHSASDLDPGRRPLSRQNSLDSNARRPLSRQNSMERGDDQKSISSGKSFTRNNSGHDRSVGSASGRGARRSLSRQNSAQNLGSEAEAAVNPTISLTLPAQLKGQNSTYSGVTAILATGRDLEKQETGTTLRTEASGSRGDRASSKTPSSSTSRSKNSRHRVDPFLSSKSDHDSRNRSRDASVIKRNSKLSPLETGPTPRRGQIQRMASLGTSSEHGTKKSRIIRKQAANATAAAQAEEVLRLFLASQAVVSDPSKKRHASREDWTTF